MSVAVASLPVSRVGNHTGYPTGSAQIAASSFQPSVASKVSSIDSRTTTSRETLVDRLRRLAETWVARRSLPEADHKLLTSFKNSYNQPHADLVKYRPEQTGAAMSVGLRSTTLTFTGAVWRHTLLFDRDQATHAMDHVGSPRARRVDYLLPRTVLIKGYNNVERGNCRRWDAPLTELGTNNSEIGARHFYEGLSAGTIAVPDIVTMSPCRRTRETAAPYLAAIEHFTGETPKQIAVWGLREQGGCVASNIEKETWDIPTIRGGTATGDRDLAWYCAGGERDLTTRGADNKEFLEALGSEIHARTGKDTSVLAFTHHNIGVTTGKALSGHSLSMRNGQRTTFTSDVVSSEDTVRAYTGKLDYSHGRDDTLSEDVDFDDWLSQQPTRAELRSGSSSTIGDHSDLTV